MKAGDQYIADHGQDEVNHAQFIRVFQNLLDLGLAEELSDKNKTILDGLIAMGVVRRN